MGLAEKPDLNWKGNFNKNIPFALKSLSENKNLKIDELKQNVLIIKNFKFF